MEDLNLVFGTPRPVALVTGSGAPRIGNCIARTLFARGYRLVLHARESIADAHTTADELDAGGSDTLVLSGNLAEEAAAYALTHQRRRADGGRIHGPGDVGTAERAEKNLRRAQPTERSNVFYYEQNCCS